MTQCLWFWGSMTELETQIQIGDTMHFSSLDSSSSSWSKSYSSSSPIIMIRKVLRIEEIVIHPSYSPSGNSFDIALLKVFILFMIIMMMIFDVTFPELFDDSLCWQSHNTLMHDAHFFAELYQPVDVNNLKCLKFKFYDFQDLWAFRW